MPRKPWSPPVVITTANHHSVEKPAIHLPPLTGPHVEPVLNAGVIKISTGPALAVVPPVSSLRAPQPPATVYVATKETGGEIASGVPPIKSLFGRGGSSTDDWLLGNQYHYVLNHK